MSGTGLFGESTTRHATGASKEKFCFQENGIEEAARFCGNSGGQRTIFEQN